MEKRSAVWSLFKSHLIVQLVSLVSLVESASLERKRSIDCEFKVIYCMSPNINLSIGLTGCSATFVCFYFDPLRRKGESQRCSVITQYKCS